METTVSGLYIFPDFINKSTEEKLLNEIDSQIWIVDYDRRLQYYGFRNELETPYDLVKLPVPIPPLIFKLSQQIVEQGILNYKPDQVIINEYYPGQGIRPHKDRNYFENQICGVNLGSSCVMQFTKASSQKIDVEIPRRSIYVMQDDARKKWNHAIPPRKKDIVDGTIYHRDRRVSITYRKVNSKKVKSINPDGRVAKMLKELFNINEFG